MRKNININSHWKFLKKDLKKAQESKYKDSNWEEISLPHTWNAFDGQDGGLDYYRGKCWYRKKIVISEIYEDKQVFLEFQGVNSIATVYINGALLGTHRGGYSTFRYDITNMLDPNTPSLIAVCVDNSRYLDVYPQMADFTFHGGIYRDVNLIITDKIHFAMLDNGSSGVFISQKYVNKDIAEIIVKAKIKNDSPITKTLPLRIIIKNREKEIVVKQEKNICFKCEETTEISVPINIKIPNLWHGIANPYLYNFNITIGNDNLEIPIGIRYYSVDPNQGFYLNGEPYPLHGVSRHQDRLNRGWAISQQDQIEDMDLIQELGANTIRLAHYQHNQFFYYLCDKNGMIVWAEIPFISMMSDEDQEGLNAKSQMIELIKQNYNHCSILFWGVQNEITIRGDKPKIRKTVKELCELTKKEDPYRLSTMANLSTVKPKNPMNSYPDLIGYNAYFGWYHDEPQDFNKYVERLHKEIPYKPIGISEYGCEANLAFHTDYPKRRDYSEEYQALYHEIVWKILKQKSFLWGTWVWNMFDFGSDLRDEGGTKGRNNKGLVTFDRKIKKDSFYWYKANWSNELFVYIASKRYKKRASDSIQIKVYSNCPEVTLHINNQEISTISSDDHIFLWQNVQLLDEKNEVRAISKGSNKTYEDNAVFEKVDKPEESYALRDAEGLQKYTEFEAQLKKNIANWFEDQATTGSMKFPEGMYSIKSTLGELLENEETKVVLAKIFGEQILTHPMLDMGINFTIEELSVFASSIITPKVLYGLNQELILIRKQENIK
ncbi:MAG: glycoside hydrolase family 2 protein [Promethearchaeota archaeon]|jgi:beta-galactosidase